MTNKKTILTLLMLGVITSTINISVLAKSSTDNYKKAVSLGANLKPAQKQQMLSQFGVSNEEIKNGDVSIIEITIPDIREQLGMDTSKPVPKDSVSISSSCVQVEPKGHGINVSTNHMTEVTGEMLSNALITCGVTDAEVKAGAPYDVTGTAALAGILKGFEQSTGKELSLENRQVAREEINTSKNLANSIGSEKATAIVSQAKKEVVKEKPGNRNAIEEIVKDTADDYGVTLQPKEQEQLVNLMERVRGLNLNYNDIKDSLNKLGDNMKEQLTKAGVNVKESGFFQGLVKNVKHFFHWLDVKVNGDTYSVANGQTVHKPGTETQSEECQKVDSKETTENGKKDSTNNPTERNEQITNEDNKKANHIENSPTASISGEAIHNNTSVTVNNNTNVQVK